MIWSNFSYFSGVFFGVLLGWLVKKAINVYRGIEDDFLANLSTTNKTFLVIIIILVFSVIGSIYFGISQQKKIDHWHDMYFDCKDSKVSRKTLKITPVVLSDSYDLSSIDLYPLSGVGLMLI